MSGGYRWSPAGAMNPAYKGGLVADRDWFSEMYCNRKMSLREVAKEAGCALRTAARWATKHGIQTRPNLEARQMNVKRGREHPSWRGAMEGHRCVDCGKQVGYYTTRCRACRTKHCRGPESPNWKGLGSVMSLVRSRVKAEWRRAVMERDNYTCVRCGDSRGGNLVAHHTRRLASIVARATEGMPMETAEQRLDAVNKALSDPQLMDVANGVTLCESCHRIVHLGKQKDIVPSLLYHYEATCLRVVDGDTGKFDISLGLSVHAHETCRLYGINAPEMRGETKAAGEAAKAHLEKLLGMDVPGSVSVKLRIDTIKDRKEKYGRYLVVIHNGQVNVNEAMVAAGHAVFKDYG